MQHHKGRIGQYIPKNHVMWINTNRNAIDSALILIELCHTSLYI